MVRIGEDVSERLAEEAIRRLAWIFWRKQAREASPLVRLAIRQDQTRGPWDKLHDWQHIERALVPDGSGIAGAIHYSLNRWGPLGRFLQDGNVSCHNNPPRELDAPLSNWSKGMAYCRERARGQACRHGHEPRAVGPVGRA
uniref:IS66 family transposase n=1 Tax=Delftia acidovorans TaxID=80866 RepID=UPI00384FE633